ncbi:MAG: acyl-CoA dehydrogenase family protein, partial [Actinobacteria bacterium]|nr:acyl-CoA dehydrogenase family protein [Actinomycetota bacterium]
MTTSAAFSRGVSAATGPGVSAGGASALRTAWNSAPKRIGSYTRDAVDLDLTPEQREVQATVRQFVDERVLPNAIENDIGHHLEMGVIEGMAELGLLGIVIPEE